MRLVISRMLNDMGFEVVQAADGAAALAAAARESFDLALVDWNMPVMDGYELLCSLRSDSRFAALRIMMVTTENELERVVSALEAGANEYLMKPFTRDAMAAKLQLMGIES